jgi:hypothetical protein
MVRPLNNDRTVSDSDCASPGFGAVITTTSAALSILEICFTITELLFGALGKQVMCH